MKFTNSTSSFAVNENGEDGMADFHQLGGLVLSAVWEISSGV